jgi:hypothetical protein
MIDDPARERLREQAARMPLWMRDQVDAAAAHLRAAWADLGAVLLDDQDLPPGPRKAIAQQFEWLAAGRVRSCRHIKADRPQPMVVPVYASHVVQAMVVACADCAEELGGCLRGTAEDVTYDGCRAYCPDGIWSPALGLGLHIFTRGLVRHLHGTGRRRRPGLDTGLRPRVPGRAAAGRPEPAVPVWEWPQGQALPRPGGDQPVSTPPEHAPDQHQPEAGGTGHHAARTGTGTGEASDAA